MSSSEPTSTSSTSSLAGDKLTSPNLSRKNNGMLDDKSIKSGVVEKLVQEFQQYYNENKETNYVVRKDTPTTSPPRFRKRNNSNAYAKKRGTRKHKSHKRNGSSNNTSSPPPQRSSAPTHITASSSAPTHNPVSPSTIRRQASSPAFSRKGQDDNFVGDILTKDGRVKHGSIIDVQQQFFKSLTNDLIKTSGSVILRPVTTTAQRRELEGAHPPSNPSSPSSLRKKGAQTEDDKSHPGKRQMSKTFDTTGSPSRTGSPPPALLSCSAPAHAGSVFSGKSPTSSPSSPRAVRSGNSPISPVPSRRSRGTPAAIVADLAIARAALNPVGLPMGYSPPTSPTASPPASPTASPTSESTPPYPFLPFATATPPSSFAVSPKPLRPMHVQSSSSSSPRGSRTSSPVPFTENAKPTIETKETSDVNNKEDTTEPKTEADEITKTNATETQKQIETKSTETQEIQPKTKSTETTTTETHITPETTQPTTTEPAAEKPHPTQADSEPAQTTTEPGTSQANPPAPQPKWEDVLKPRPYPTRPSAGTMRPIGSAFLAHSSPVYPTSPTPASPAPLSSSTSSVTPPATPPLVSQSSLSMASWTPCRPQVNVSNSNTPQHRTQSSPKQARPMSTIGVIRYTTTSPTASPSSLSPSDSHFTQYAMSPNMRYQSTTPGSPTTTTSAPSSRTPSPTSLQSSTTDLQVSVDSLPNSSSTTPTTLSPLASTTPPPDPFNLLPPLALSGGSSPTPSPRDSPFESPRDPSEPPLDPARRVTESPRGWGVEDIAIHTTGWRSPTLAYLSASTSALPPASSHSPRLARSSINHHRLNRTNSSMADLNTLLSPPRTPPESPTPMSEGNNRKSGGTFIDGSNRRSGTVVEGNRRSGGTVVEGNNRRSGTIAVVEGNNRPHAGSGSGTTIEGNSRPHAGSGSGPTLGNSRPHAGSGSGVTIEGNSRPHAGSGSASTMPVRSSSDSHVDKASRSGSLDQDDPTQQLVCTDEVKPKMPLTRSNSAWQLKGNTDYTDLEESFSENRTDLIYTHTKAGTKIVKAGTLNALIEVLTYQKQSDPAFVDAFLLTYPSFTTPMTLLEKLIERYNQTPPADLTPEQREEYENDNLIVRLRVCSVLKSWADKHYYDFQKEPLLVDTFVNFMDSLKERGMEKVAGTIVRALQKKLDGAGKKIILTPSTPIPSPVMPKGDNITFLNFEDVEVARQLTLMEYESYCCIRPRECLNQAWNKPNRDEESPNIVTMIRRSNSIPLWVATEIIKEDKLQRRVHVLKKFINIAEFCRQLNNFNAVMEIVSGLNLTPVYRLRKTWDALPRKQILFFEQLSALMAPKSNFKVYREELHTKNPPCVPFLGRYLTDLTFIEDAAKESGEGMINFVKRMQLSVVIREIQQYQQTPYNLAIVPGIRDYLSKIDSFPENELYAQSRILEPSVAT